MPFENVDYMENCNVNVQFLPEFYETYISNVIGTFENKS